MLGVSFLLVSLSAGDPPAPVSVSAKKSVVRVSPALQYDLDKKIVVLEAEVAMRDGPLELLLCPRRTKEHESILAAPFEPKALQFALLLIGAVPGEPARFDPFKPPTGQRIEITVEYEWNGKQHSHDARQWVRDGKTKQAMTADFVFAGSRLQKVPGVDRPIFLADDGDVVCLSNFPGSMIDVAMQSSKNNNELAFESFTDRIPPKGTKVRVILKPIAPTKPA